MTKMIVVRGVMASGKSTQARMMLANSDVPMIHIERDKIRRERFGSEAKAKFSREVEEEVTKVQLGQIKAAIGAGISVVESSTNLSNKNVKELLKVAVQADPKVEIEFVDLRDVPLDVLHERNNAREDGVPAEVIDKAYQRYIKGGQMTHPNIPEPKIEEHIEEDPYVAPEGGRKTILLDIDGTVANHEGIRSPYDTSKYREDTPHQDVIDIVQALHSDGFDIHVFSGRHVDFKEDLVWWLDKHGIPFSNITMRERAQVPDYKEKLYLFNKYVRNNPDIAVHSVFDDRKQVVDKCWRNVLKIRCFAVADGDF